MATISHQLNFHDAGALVTCEHSGTTAWLDINSEQSVKNAPAIAVFFNLGLKGAAQIRALIAQLEEAELALMADAQAEVRS
jgi:hypothetical protein